jgi:hypothetical protein
MNIGQARKAVVISLYTIIFIVNITKRLAMLFIQYGHFFLVQDNQTHIFNSTTTEIYIYFKKYVHMMYILETRIINSYTRYHYGTRIAKKNDCEQTVLSPFSWQ